MRISSGSDARPVVGPTRPLLLAVVCLGVVLGGAEPVSAQGSEPRLLVPVPGSPPPSQPPAPAVPSAAPPAVLGAPSTPPPGGPGGAGGGPGVARLEVRMGQLEEDLRTVTGRLEDVTFQLRRLDERLTKLASDIDFRLSQARPAEGAPADPAAGAPAGVSGSSPRTGQTPPTAAAPPAPAANQPPKSPRDQYAAAFAMLEKQNYATAATAFDEFLRAYPDDPLADNARYWLGETYYARGEYARAAEIFLDGYEKNRTSAKAPDTLLKLGLSLAGLDKKKEACASFRELNRAFPNAPAPVKDRAGQESKRLGCA